MKKRIGIFSGSFDPVHSGHIEAVRSFLESGLIDEIWVLLTPDPPHKGGSEKTEWEHRFNMLNLAFEGQHSVVVSDIEKELPTPSYTLQTIDHLQSTYPDHTFFLCLGEDSIQYFDTWHRYRDILDRVTLLAVTRPGYNALDVDPSVLERTIFVEHKPIDISSTGIRTDRPKVGEANRLPESVSAYIRKHNLYS